MAPTTHGIAGSSPSKVFLYEEESVDMEMHPRVQSSRKSVHFSPRECPHHDNSPSRDRDLSGGASQYAARVLTPTSGRQQRRLSLSERSLLAENRDKENESVPVADRMEQKPLGSAVVYAKIRLSEKHGGRLGSPVAVSPVRHSMRTKMPEGRVDRNTVHTLLQETNFCFSPNLNLRDSRLEEEEAERRRRLLKTPLTVRRTLF